MSLDLSPLRSAPRLLLECELRPVQGSRFQPTGFPDLGAATFTALSRNPDGAIVPVESLLVESAQSVANRLEAVCWDEATNELVGDLAGLPYVMSTLPDGTTTNSVLEAHRLNSPYIVNSAGFAEIAKAIGFEGNKPFDRRKLAAALLRYDPNSLLHGIFLEKVGGVVRLPRAMSGFIEASDVKVVSSGGVKVDRVQPATGETTPYGKAQEGYGNVPYHREEYTAGSIKAYFSLDLAQIRGYGLGGAAENLLITLALYKIRRFLDAGLRLRTACDFEPTGEVAVKRPNGFSVPDAAELGRAVAAAITAAQASFATPAITSVKYAKAK